MSGPGLRDNIKAISPPWLQDGYAEKKLYVAGLMNDLVLEKWSQGVQARRSTDCDPTALPLIGDDRVMPQGPNEPVANYRLRLQRAFETWKIAGSARSIMGQVLAYVLPSTPMVRVVKNALIGLFSQRNIWDTYVAGSDPTQPPAHQLTDYHFDWDGLTRAAAVRWRVWLIIYSLAGSPWPTEGTWGDGDLWGDFSKSWGIGTPATTFDAIRALLKQWRSAGSWFIPAGGIIVAFNGSEFDPDHTSGGGVNPDGTWLHFGKDVAGTYVPARFDDARYVDGA